MDSPPPVHRLPMLHGNTLSDRCETTSVVISSVSSMKILTRYILLECLVFFGISLFAFTGILLTVQMLRFSDLIINRGVQIGQIATVFLAIAPTFMELAVPMAALIGVMLAFARLSGDSEIVVLRASGVSLYQLLRPVLLLAAALGAIAMEVSTELKPWGHRTLSLALFEIAKSRSTAGLEEGIFNKLGDLTLYGQSVDYNTGELKGVMVDDRRNAENREIIFAESASILSDEIQQTISIKLRQGSAHKQSAETYNLTRFATYDVVMDPNRLFGTSSGKEMSPRAMYIEELDAQIPRFQEYENKIVSLEKSAPSEDSTPVMLTLPSGQKMSRGEITKHFRRLRMERAMRYSMPYAACILAIIAMPLGIQPPRTQRTWGATISFGLGLMVFVFYYAILSLGVTLVESGSLSAVAAAWLPNFAVTGVAIWMLFYLGTERGSSISHLLEQSIENAYKVIRRRK